MPPNRDPVVQPGADPSINTSGDNAERAGPVADAGYRAPSLVVYGGIGPLTNAVGTKGKSDMSGARKTGF